MTENSDWPNYEPPKSAELATLKIMIKLLGI